MMSKNNEMKMLFRLVYMQSNWTKLVYDNFSNKTTNSEILKSFHVTVVQIYPSFESKLNGVKISVHNFKLFVPVTSYWIFSPVQNTFVYKMFPNVTNVSLQTVLQFYNPQILLNFLSNILSKATSLKAQLVRIHLQCRRPQFDSWVGKIC